MATMDNQRVVQKVQELSDVELAALLCLVANQHCIIQTDKDFLDGLRDELQLVPYRLFTQSELRLRQP